MSLTRLEAPRGRNCVHLGLSMVPVPGSVLRWSEKSVKTGWMSEFNLTASQLFQFCHLCPCRLPSLLAIFWVFHEPPALDKMNATVTGIIAEIFLSGNYMPGILRVLSPSRLKTIQWVRSTHDRLHFTDEKTEVKVTTTSGWMVKPGFPPRWVASELLLLTEHALSTPQRWRIRKQRPRYPERLPLAPVAASLASGSFSHSLCLLQEGFRHRESFRHQHHPILPATYSLIPFSHGDTRLWQSPPNGSNYEKNPTTLLTNIFW